MIQGSKFSQPFAIWPSGYFGALVDDEDARFRSRIYGFDTVMAPDRAGDVLEIPPAGACFGFVQAGEVEIGELDQVLEVREGGYFATRNGARFSIGAGTRVVIIQQIGFYGFNVAGGPIESLGRLRYIDRCSDSLLVAPPLFGDPCLNHLHFPPGIDQTAHTHPSTRAGIVASGAGVCRLADGEHALTPGAIFWIPTGGVHAFKTEAARMNVIAYHPDSDFGPKHEDHPMVNRTIVDGAKIDNSSGIHATADVEPSRFDPPAAALIVPGF